MYRSSGGSLQVIESGIALPYWDRLDNTTPGTSTETYVFRRGGSGGDVVATVVVVFTDATKAEILSVTKTPTV